MNTPNATISTNPTSRFSLVAKRLMAVVLSAALAVGLVPSFAFAAQGESLAAGVAATSLEGTDFAPQADDGWTACGSCEWKKENGTLTIRPINGASAGTLDYWNARAPWSGVKNNPDRTTKKVVIKPGVSTATCAGMFNYMITLTSVDLSGLDTTGVSSMQSMFNGCYLLKSVNLSSLNTANVTNMGSMFASCYALTGVDLSKLNLGKVKYMDSMVTDCYNVATFKLPASGTPSLTDVGSMFMNCSSLKSLNFTGLTTKNITNMASMFASCTKLATLKIDTWNTSKVTNMTSMFSKCKALTTLDLSSFNTKKVASVMAMFSGCSKLKTIRATSSFVVTQAASEAMFDGCSQLVGGKGTHYSASHTSGAYARIDKSGAPGYFTGEQAAVYKHSLEASDVKVAALAARPYNGAAQTPNPTLKHGTYTLKKNIDYTLEYANNTMPGTATVKVKGKGTYTKSRTLTFKITKVNLSKASVTLSANNFVYDGKAKTPVVTVRANGRTLKQNVDFSVAYANNKNAGTGKVTVKGKAGYEGSKSVSFTIKKTSLSKAKLTGLVSKARTGKAVKQVPVVTVGKTTLKNGKDFTVAYKNNKKVGKATVTVKGKGKYTGSKSATFKIVKYKQPMTVKVAKKTVVAKAATVKKKAVTLAKPVTVKKAKGKVTYSNVSTQAAAKKLKVNAKTGKITVPKGMKKGTYTLKLKVASAGSGNYAYGDKTVSVKVKVK